MMKKYFFILALFTLSNAVAFAQTFNYDVKTSWNDKPVLHEVQKPYDSSSAVGILDERTIEYAKEKDDIVVYEYKHFIIKVMNDNGIESFNKIYIPVSENAEIQNIQARTITPSGKVILLDTNTIKDAEEDDQKYKLFALAGLETNAEIEYSYTVKRNLFLFGSETFQRTNIPVLHATFALITPAYLKFDAKGYNGFLVSSDSAINEKRIIVGYSNNIDEMEAEKYAQADPHLQRVDYKLSYNLSKNPDVRLYTWKEYAQKTYSYYTSRSSKEEKVLSAFISKIPMQQANSDAEKIIAVEDYLKNNFNIDKDVIGSNTDNIEWIIKNKASNNDGIVRLFAGIFDNLRVNYQIVFPGTRTGYTLDENLEDWNRASDALFYFPSTGKFLSPLTIDLRYPYVPYEYTETRSLFLKGTVIGDFKTAIGTFANIPIEPFDQHVFNVDADISFNNDLDTAIISLKKTFKGYAAQGYRPIYNYLTPDKQAEANKEIIKENTESEDFSNLKVENTAFADFFTNKPLTISADVKSSDLVERAGNSILLKIGAIIGPQEQMYQEKPRHLPIELPFPHSLNRTITLHIPDDYVVKNLNDLNMNVAYKNNDVTTMGFTSNYSQVGNIITVTINEVYHEIKYPLSQFEDFKKVINASADFNKIVLVLEKK